MNRKDGTPPTIASTKEISVSENSVMNGPRLS